VEEKKSDEKRGKRDVSLISLASPLSCIKHLLAVPPFSGKRRSTNHSVMPLYQLFLLLGISAVLQQQLWASVQSGRNRDAMAEKLHISILARVREVSGIISVA